MVSNLSSTLPAVNSDGTISAIVREIQTLPEGKAILRLWLPISFQTGGGFGRFFLARCAEDTPDARRTEWSIYTRRAITCAGAPVAMLDQAGSLWDFFIPDSTDPGYHWLLHRLTGAAVNLLGPFGQEFTLESNTRALLLLADLTTFALILPLIPPLLDRGGRVVLLIRGEVESPDPYLSRIPIPVEVRIIPSARWNEELTETLRWADQLCAALPNQDYAELAHQIRAKRFHLDSSFAHALISSDLICGVGACLACVIATKDGGYTRACVHGPVFPLTTLFA